MSFSRLPLLVPPPSLKDLALTACLGCDNLPAHLKDAANGGVVKDGLVLRILQEEYAKLEALRDKYRSMDTKSTKRLRFVACTKQLWFTPAELVSMFPCVGATLDMPKPWEVRAGTEFNLLVVRIPNTADLTPLLCSSLAHDTLRAWVGRPMVFDATAVLLWHNSVPLPEADLCLRHLYRILGPTGVLDAVGIVGLNVRVVCFLLDPEDKSTHVWLRVLKRALFETPRDDHLRLTLGRSADASSTLEIDFLRSKIVNSACSSFNKKMRRHAGRSGRSSASLDRPTRGHSKRRKTLDDSHSPC